MPLATAIGFAPASRLKATNKKDCFEIVIPVRIRNPDRFFLRITQPFPGVLFSASFFHQAMSGVISSKLLQSLKMPKRLMCRDN
jgi:hypothetical protein